MTSYLCKLCNYSTINKSNYNKHLITQKHLKIENNYGGYSINSQIKSQKEPKKSQKEPKKSQKEPTRFNCNFCEKDFSTFANKRRHELHRCKKTNAELTILKNQKKELEKQILKLLDKVGTVNNNNTNNIIS
jgi:hypothetical protein